MIFHNMAKGKLHVVYCRWIPVVLFKVETVLFSAKKYCESFSNAFQTYLLSVFPQNMQLLFCID